MKTKTVLAKPDLPVMNSVKPDLAINPLEVERVDTDYALSEVLADIKKHLGVCVVAEAGCGKSYLAVQLCLEACRSRDTTVIVLSPSNIWSRNLWPYNFVKVGTASFNPIVEIQEFNNDSVESIPNQRDTIRIILDKKWEYIKDGWLESLLDSKQNLLFEIKYLNGRKIKAFETVVLRYIFEKQREELEADSNYSHHYIICLEEAQNSFGTYSLNSDDSLELFSVFTTSRSDANIHYIYIGQRLADISTKIVERLKPIIGRTIGENSLKKIRSQLPEHLKKRIQELPDRTWIYLNGSDNPEIVTPHYQRYSQPRQLIRKDKVEVIEVIEPTVISRIQSVIQRLTGIKFVR